MLILDSCDQAYLLILPVPDISKTFIGKFFPNHES